MPSQSENSMLAERELADYGFARVRDIAFDAVQALWRRRQGEGWQQKQIAEAIGRDRGWVSKRLRGPSNWTMRTFGELVGGLQGEVEISVHAIEDHLTQRSNFDAYLGYSTAPVPIRATSGTPANAGIELRIRPTSNEMLIEVT